MALAIAFTDFGDSRASPAAATLGDTMVLPASSNAVLFLLVLNLHNGATTTGSLSLTAETVETIRALGNAADSSLVNVGAYAVRNPTAGAKTLTLADDGLLRSFAWVGWLVTGVPSSAFTDDIVALEGSATTSTTLNTGNITTTKPSGLILTAWGFRGQTGPFSISGGWIEDADDTTGPSLSTDFGYVAGHLATTTVGAYASTATATAAGHRAMIALSVLPSLNRRSSQVILT